jgi:hypothetical protein
MGALEFSRRFSSIVMVLATSGSVSGPVGDKSKGLARAIMS